jgi:hypothetical protein
MPRPEYRDEKRKTVYLEKVDPVIKEDFLDICHRLDLKQTATFEELVRFYYLSNKVKPRPSRNKS